MRVDRIWVVEIFVDSSEWGVSVSRWEPTVEACLTREDGRLALKEWHKRCPHDKLRLSAYVREER